MNKEKLTWLLNILKTKEITLLPETITVGNHLVYKLNLDGDISTGREEGILILTPGSGIKTHEHPVINKVPETYESLMQKEFQYLGIKYLTYTCSLGGFHGIDIEDELRLVNYQKWNITRPQDLIRNPDLVNSLDILNTASIKTIIPNEKYIFTTDDISIIFLNTKKSCEEENTTVLCEDSTSTVKLLLKQKNKE